MIRLVSLLIPTHVKPQHFGQTPNAYQHKVTAKFEKAINALSPVVIKRTGILGFTQDPQQGLQILGRVSYDVAVELADDSFLAIAQLVLTTFELKAFTAHHGDKVASFDADALESFAAGLHDWNEE